MSEAAACYRVVMVLEPCEVASYHFIVFRGQLEDASQLGIHEIIGLGIFPLAGVKNCHVNLST